MAGRYKAYPEYKASGVQWLGDIPSDWRVIPLKHLATLNPKKSGINKQKMSDHCSFVPMDKLKLNSLKLDETKLISDVYDGYTYFENEDVLMAKVTPCFENKNMAVAKNLLNGIGFGSSEIYVLRTNSKLNNQFLFYRLQEDGFMEIATAAMSGAGGLKRVPAEIINTFLAAFPLYEEQQKIASFLDHETAKIDTLIAKQEKLIALLKEKRQAVISHAVTKGLNPDAPMKDSGVEWLGEVPEHWELTRAKFVSKIFVPQRNKPELNSNNVGTPWATMDDMKSDVILSTYHAVSDEALKSASSKVLPKGSVIASCVGNFGVASINKMDVVINQQLQAYIAKRISPLYLRELVSISKCYFELVGTAATLVYVNQQGFENLPITLPSIEEQQDITDYLTAQKGKFDTLIGKCFNQVELMKERKTALISAAVTGKIDVRHFVTEQGQSQGVQG
ncbi:restriction endonuclease subunit S [Vibrio cholerae]|uniref:restriction endonuclease subunit S n=1 Tax=Vibrio cholerae TaxID=666 RepID=UPI0015CF7860|nr:restriction endonuclease subunit S [Vibrio cholerae]HBK7309936.1 restriction endonuclease subunit S [Vibrio cholerae]